MKKRMFFLLLMGLCVCAAKAQHAGSEAAKDANNPLASIKAASVHNVYVPSLCDGEGTVNTMWLRYAQPIGRVLIRASLPINSVDVPGTRRSGLGDLNVFGTYILTRPDAHAQLGVGPILSFPTAASSALGSGKWQAGAAFVGYFDANPVFQFGFLATWQHSFAGRSSRSKVNAASLQPFLMWQLGKGLYLRSSAIALLDFERRSYLVPLGLGIGKVLSLGKSVCNLFVEPQFAAFNKGSGLPKTQVFVGVNTQF